MIEHNLPDVIKTADYIVDLGLEGGDQAVAWWPAATEDAAADPGVAHFGAICALCWAASGGRE